MRVCLVESNSYGKPSEILAIAKSKKDMIFYKGENDDDDKVTSVYGVLPRYKICKINKKGEAELFKGVFYKLKKHANFYDFT